MRNKIRIARVEKLVDEVHLNELELTLSRLDEYERRWRECFRRDEGGYCD